jgi:hypothetical protein
MFEKRKIFSLGINRAKKDNPVDVWQGRAGARLQRIGFNQHVPDPEPVEAPAPAAELPPPLVPAAAPPAPEAKVAVPAPALPPEAALAPERTVHDRLMQNLLVQEQLTAQINQAMRAQGISVPGILKPFFLLDPSFWNGELGVWLVEAFGMMPFEDWNRVYLPDTEDLARALNSSPHPGGMSMLVAEMAVDRVTKAKAAYEAAHSMQAEGHKVAIGLDLKSYLQTVLATACDHYREHFLAASDAAAEAVG